MAKTHKRSKGSASEGLFGVKKQQFGRTRSAHGRKRVTSFNRLVFDPVKNQAVTVRRHTQTY